MSAGPGRLGRRLSRILLLLPYAIQHPGTTVAELSRRFGVPKTELINDLNLVFLCGLPGYGPGDLIDVDFQDDRIFIHMADYFSAPLRLTPAEGLALYAGGEAIAALPDMEQAESLKRALQKLGRALGAGRDGDDSAAIKVRFEESPPAHMVVLQQALAARKQVEIEYLSSTRSETTTRNIEPWGLIAALGRWYVVGLDHLSGEERMFRVDRIKSSTVTDESAAPPDDFDAERYKGAFVGREGQPVVAMDISPDAARWFEDYYPVASSAAVADGWRRVELQSSGDRWAATLVLRLGSQVRNVVPDSVTKTAHSMAANLAERHEGTAGRK
ncbi:MAG TPA: WYL domain-containing protein [Actinomycetota bacterium]|nr:WYL domain-containing protein [Actinomycetota bacterium]